MREEETQGVMPKRLTEGEASEGTMCSATVKRSGAAAGGRSIRCEHAAQGSREVTLSSGSSWKECWGQFVKVYGERKQ